ncbi:MAG TPA: DNA mismatch repair protein MutS [Myxococcota bacterium]|nr:DNA mismatch repair protein MutS [Myxococcota bacterium]
MGIASDASQGAHIEYARRLDARRADAVVRSRRASIAANLRLLVFACGLAVAWLAFGSRALSALWLGPPLLAFVALVAVHDRLLGARDRALRSVAFYARALSRLESRWAGGGAPGERFQDSAHSYAEDLDLFGRGSLFELLCEARTRAGEETLAAWLLAPATAPEIRARQAAVRELAPRLDLREDLARLGDEVRAGLHPQAVCEWGAAPAALGSRAPALIAAGLAALAVAGLVHWLATPAGPLAFLLALLLEAGFWVFHRRRVQAVVGGVDLPGRDLELLAQLLARLEREPHRAERLEALHAALQTDGARASDCIARLRRWIDLLDARRNQLFAPLAALLLWTPQCAFAIERWRSRHGAQLARWIDAVGEIEALSALATLHFEHPEYSFPEIVEAGPCFEALAIGHPLLPADRCVRNDVSISAACPLLIVSGSNMSGKSTLLRCIGINAVLALAGAPVCAQRLRLSALAIGASIRLRDSLLEGSSRFYSEILRLRQIAELTRSALPVLFLLDEILNGTNSHDRGIGAEAVVRNLIDAGGIGLVTTHDLALTRLADALAPRAANVHFEDHLENGAMAFDYRMRPGVVTKSNALELMRAVGLDV